MKVLIVEDEKIAAQRLVEMLRKINPAIRVLEVLDSVEAFLAFGAEQAREADLIFMDIELGDGQSFDIFSKVSIDVPVIFITAYQQHALKAFKLHSVDYLLKPLKREALEAALAKYEKYYDRESPDLKAQVAAVLKTFQKENQEGTKTRFLAKNGTRLISVAANQIAYFFTRDKLHFLKTNKDEDYIIDKNLEEVEAELDGSTFFRANRQFIINYNHIEKVYAWFNGKLKVQVHPKSYEEIIVSRLKANEFKKWLGE